MEQTYHWPFSLQVNLIPLSLRTRSNWKRYSIIFRSYPFNPSISIPMYSVLFLSQSYVRPPPLFLWTTSHFASQLLLPQLLPGLPPKACSFSDGLFSSAFNHVVIFSSKKKEKKEGKKEGRVGGQRRAGREGRKGEGGEGRKEGRSKGRNSFDFMSTFSYDLISLLLPLQKHCLKD